MESQRSDAVAYFGQNDLFGHLATISMSRPAKRPRSMCQAAQTAGGVEPFVHWRDFPQHSLRENRRVLELTQVVGNHPDIVVRGHPIAAVELPQIDGARIGA